LEPRRLQRFLNEAQAAARLQHPHIVPVYAVGSDQGTHYYAMQLVEGVSAAELIRFLRRQAGKESAPPAAAGPAADTPLPHRAPPAAPPRGRFERVARWGLQAAAALAYAHEVGVVHRDVKPANLLLDLRGGLWVADFGLARLRGESDLTATGDLVGTLRYMSPEQAQGARAVTDHRVDVYGLGATLYELLTLEPALAGDDGAHLQQRLLTDDPVPPRALDPSIPVDLETVVLKALRKSPVERYATAQELADDLGRFLEGQPVRARRPTARERARAWRRRHPVLVGSSLAGLLVAVLALAVGIAAVRHERDEAWRQRDEAARRRAEAIDAVNDMCQFAETWLVQQPRQERARRYFLEKARAFYERLAAEHGDDPEVRGQRAAATRRLAHALHWLGDDRSAEAAFRQALEQAERLAAEEPGRPEHAFARAGCAQDFARFLSDTGRFADGDQYFRRAVDDYRALVRDHPDRWELPPDLAGCLSTYAILRWQGSQAADAEDMMREAAERLDRAVAEHLGPARLRMTQAFARANLGSLLIELGRPARAAEELRRASDRFAAPELEELRDTIDYRRGLAMVHRCQSLVRAAAEEWPAAAQEAEQAVTALGQLRKDFPAAPILRREWAQYSFDFAEALGKLGRPDRAEQTLLAVADALAAEGDRPPGPPDLLARRAGADVHFYLGVARARRGRPAEAEASFREATDRYDQLSGEFPGVPLLIRHQARAWGRYGELLRDRGRHAEAVAAIRRGIDLRRSLPASAPIDRRFLAGQVYNLGLIYQKTGRPPEAERAYREALAIQDAVVVEVPDSEDYRRLLVYICNNLAGLLNDNDRLGEAKPVLGKILEREAILRDTTDPSCLIALGQAHLLTGDPRSAVGPLERGRQRSGGNMPAVFFLLATAHARVGNADEARRWLGEGDAWLKANHSSNPDLDEMRKDAEVALREQAQATPPKRP
jgi:tetratricopeptide (TPR) repeat protein